ncbi:hypothetical protein [Nocardioides sp.]|uniref:hypothetical protein n=1 Tax=Nocardioides sp. TaxID=35761 RepID=UPI003D1443B4
MSLLIASDLDRTLIYSAAAMTLGEPVPDPRCVEVLDGREISFISPVALAGLAALSQRVAFVPTTTRTAAQFQRIDLPGVRHDMAITTNGGRLLLSGQPCPDWDREVADRLAGSASYDEAAVALAGVLDQPWVLKIRDAERLFVYTVLERSGCDPDWFEELEAVATGLGWTLSVQGRKAYVVPAALTKEAALAEVVRRCGATQVVAAGDSLLDRGLLECADVAIRPAHGELHDAGWCPPGLLVTARAGGGAAEEIVAHFVGFDQDRAD